MAAVEPSRPQNAYWIFLSESRPALTKEAGSGSAPLIGKLGGAKWKAMSAEAKKPYEQKAVASKAAYEKAMEEFKVAGGQPGKRRQDKKDAKAKTVAKKAKKEARNNSGQPKRPPSGFWLWQTDNREALQKEAGTKNPAAIGKLSGAKWKALGSAEKVPFEKRAEVEKAKYTKALEEWKAQNAATEAAGEGEGDEDEDEGGEDA